VLMPDGARGVGLRRQLGRVARRAVLVLPRLRWPLLALGAAAALLLWQRSPLWSAELGALSPISRQAQALDESLRADLSAGDGGAMVVVQGPSVEATLERAEAAGQRLDALVDAGRIGGYSSVTRWLPSLATQRARQAALPDAATLHTALDAATQGLPLKAARLGPFVADVEQARRAAPLNADTLRASPVAPFVDALLLRRPDGSAVALMPLQAAGGHDAALDGAAVHTALQGLPGTQMLAIGSELHRLYRHYLAEAQTQALLGALGVVVLVALWLRSWRRVLAVCQPLLLAVLLTLGGLVALHVQLGILHLVGLLLVVAVGSNYALFFDLLRDDPGADDDTLASLLLANLTTVLSFGLIALSAIPALSAIGRVVAPGALLALLLSASFAPRAAPPAPSV
jgi:predicted exporter